VLATPPEHVGEEQRDGEVRVAGHVKTAAKVAFTELTARTITIFVTAIFVVAVVFLFVVVLTAPPPYFEAIFVN
jgi:hypothetical protein